MSEDEREIDIESEDEDGNSVTDHGTAMALVFGG